MESSRPFVISPYSTREAALQEKDAYTLFASRLDDIAAAVAFETLFYSSKYTPTVELFNDLIYSCVSKDNINVYSPSPIVMAMRMLWTSDPTLSNGWKKAIQHLIALGADLRKGSRRSGMLLEDIMNFADGSWKSSRLGDEWLDTLKRAGVDVAEYLKVERFLHSNDRIPYPAMEPHPKFDYRMRHLIFSDEGPGISWDWYIDPEGSAYDVLEEFKNFGPSRHEPCYDWKYPEQIENWPFIYGCWDYSLDWGLGSSDDKVFATAERWQARFEYRWHKKAEKLVRVQGIRKGPKVPGAWID